MKRLVSGFYPVIAGAMLATTLLFAGASLYLYFDMQRVGTEDRLRGTARLLAALMSAHSPLDPAGEGFNSRLAAITEGLEARITVIDGTGRVLADTERDPAGLDNHAGRPELAAALEGREKSVARHSATLGARAIYAAAPVLRDGRIVFAVRASHAAGALTEGVLRAMLVLGLAMLLLLIGTALFVYRSGRTLARPLEALCRAAERFAAGELSFRAAEEGPLEIAGLARGLNAMAAELAARMQELEGRRTELEAILDAMGEALILVDSKLRIRLWNPAAARLFGGLSGGLPGVGLAELTRSNELAELARRALESGAAVVGEVSLFRDAALLLQVRATPVRGTGGGEPGVLLVLNDVTRLTRLETIRRDFVANVSHELRTPVTSIKGFVETLKDSRLEDRKAALRFLDIIARQTGRLEAIIEDLLSLAELEQTGKSGVAKADSELRAILRNAAANCRGPARDKKIKLRIDCPKVEVFVNASLIEQAVTNLVDNAVKYSPRGTAVDIAARLEGDWLEIKVKDQGKGIPARDLPRLFERFYVVDKARSRELGGTGLGLAIVKHIVLAHGGAVSVESWLDSGSVFTFRLPAQTTPRPAK